MSGGWVIYKEDVLVLLLPTPLVAEASAVALPSPVLKVTVVFQHGLEEVPSQPTERLGLLFL